MVIFHSYVSLPEGTLSYVVGGFNHLEKYEFVSWDDDIPNMKWKIIQMFQTTNQI